MGLCRQKENLRLSPFRRWILLIIGVFDCALFGGAIFGWPQLVYFLKKEDIYGHLCQTNLSLLNSITQEPKIMDTSDFGTNQTDQLSLNNELYSSWGCKMDNSSIMNITQTNNCAKQDEIFALIYTVSCVMYGTPGMIIGFLLHYAGLVFTRMLAGVGIAFSFLCLAMTTKESPNWLWPAMIILSTAGNAIRMSVLQLGDLFPKKRSTVITLVSGIYSLSPLLFYAFQVTDNQGIPKTSVCYFLSSLGLLSALLAFLSPCHHIPYAEETVHLQAEKRFCPPLLRSVKSVSYSLCLFWVFCGLFILNMYSVSYNVWITSTSCSNEEVRLLSNLFSFCSVGSALVSPAGGFFTDVLVRKARRKNPNSPETRHLDEIKANFGLLLFTTCFMVAMHVCLFFFDLSAVIISLFCLSIVRPYVIAVSCAFLRIRFPPDHFNRLVGIVSTMSSVLLLLVFPMFKAAKENYYVTHGGILLVIMISFSFPLHLLCERFISEKPAHDCDQKAQQEATESNTLVNT